MRPTYVLFIYCPKHLYKSSEAISLVNVHIIYQPKTAISARLPAKQCMIIYIYYLSYTPKTNTVIMCMQEQNLWCYPEFCIPNNWP